MTSTERLPRYQREVGGLVLPVAVASHPALDFCNTLAGWGDSEPYEYLTSYGHLAVWAREAGLVDAQTATRVRAGADLDPAGATRQLQNARSLREAVYAACTDPRSDAAWETVAQRARAAAAHAVLSRDDPPGRRWSIADTSLARPVLEVARSAGDLLAALDLSQVKACPGTGCGWLFVDSRGRRRWCSMEVCGNRAKARRHARRARETTRREG